MPQPEVVRKAVTEPEITMNVMQALRRRRAVHSYKQQPIDRNTINALLILGVPEGATPPVSRKPPEIIAW